MIQPAPQRGKQRIIIIEDNALVAKFFQVALERAGGFPVSLPKMCPASLAKSPQAELTSSCSMSL